MPLVPRPRWTWLGAWLCYASCATPTIDPGWTDAVALRHDDPVVHSAVATRLVDGVDDANDADLAPGDEALFRVALHRGETVERAWLVRLVVDRVDIRDGDGEPVRLLAGRTDEGRTLFVNAAWISGLSPDDASKLGSPVIALRVRVFDADGALRGDSVVHVGRDFLRDGFVAVCDAGDAEGDDEVRSCAHATLATKFR
jgi:hypothetical protein